MFGRTACEREPEVLRADASGSQSDAVRAHVAGCARCRDAIALVRWMRRMADTTGEPHALPDPGALWWRAQLVRRWQAERRACAPMETMQGVELWVGVISVVILLAWLGPAVRRLLSVADASLDALTVTRWTWVVEPSMLFTILPLAIALLGVVTLITVTRMMITE